MSRKLVKATYAHKRGRVNVANKSSSSPLQDLREQDTVSRSEMSRRMLKRSHRSEQAHINSERDPLATQERTSKRLKPTHEASNDLPEPTVVNYLHFETGDATYQTPYPSAGTEQFKLNSSIGQNVPSEKFSPLPVARRILSRTSSRNLKENSSRPSSRHLASPFSSRPGSTASSPKKNTKGKRPAASAKPRTLSDANKQNIAQRQPSASVTHSTQNSPKSLARDRRPSVPNATLMLQQISHQDWLVPAKALSRVPLRGSDSVFGSPSDHVIGSSPFFDDFPQAVSTPYHEHLNSNSEYEIRTRNFQSNPYARSGVYIDDATMLDGTVVQPGTPERPSRDAHSSPQNQPGVFKLVSLRKYDFAFPHLVRSPGGYDSDEDSIISPTRPVRRPIELPPLDGSPEGFSIFPLPPPFTDPSLTSHPAWAQTDDQCMLEPIVTSSAHNQGSSGSTKEGLQNMFSVLGLNDANKELEPLHDSGVNMPAFTRSHSLDSPVDIKAKAENSTRTRDRRGTIRASDFTFSKDSAGNNVVTTRGGAPLTRRTRSGTVIGPSKPSNSTSTKMLAPAVPLAGGNPKPIDKPGRNDAALLPPLMDGDSEDELLLKVDWHDDHWVPLAERTRRFKHASGLLPPTEDESDDDLLLKVEKAGP